MMPNRYLPRELVEMIDERHQREIRQADTDEYVAEHEVLVAMLQSEFQQEYATRSEQ